MKILVCTDWSEQSQRALKETLKIANGCNADEVTIIHVYDSKPVLSNWGADYEAYIKRFKESEKQIKEESKLKLSETAKAFEDNNIKVATIFREGHAADTIVKVASEEAFDMVVLGSRGLGGLKKLFLGSVSNAVMQEIKSNVLIVK